MEELARLVQVIADLQGVLKMQQTVIKTHNRMLLDLYERIAELERRAGIPTEAERN